MTAATSSALGAGLGPGAKGAGFARVFMYLGPAALVGVGYMDPGNWATDFEGGGRFGYQLLWVLVGSNVLALLLQSVAAKLGIGSGEGLAEACRRYYGPAPALALWLLAEVAIVACDLAEVLGSAIALNLLFRIPLVWGALLTALDVLVLLAFRGRRSRLETLVSVLVLVVGGCLVWELVLVHPPLAELASGFVPRLRSASLYVGVSMLGATVMPHNLYLHSALVAEQRQRAWASARDSLASRRQALRANVVSTVAALNVALLINVAILVLAATSLKGAAEGGPDLREAYHLLSPVVGSGLAATLFAVALLCAGQSATLTGTLAGQLVMEGFVRLRVSPLARRLGTRALAVVPAVAVLSWGGEAGSTPLLVATQVVLGLQLPFAIVPLLRFTRAKAIVGALSNGRALHAAVVVAAVIVVAANVALLVHVRQSVHEGSPPLGYALDGVSVLAAAFLAFIALVPLKDGRPAGALAQPPAP